MSDERKTRAAIAQAEQLSHPTLLQMRGHWEDDDALYVVEEYASKGDLMQDSLSHPEK